MLRQGLLGRASCVVLLSHPRIGLPAGVDPAGTMCLLRVDDRDAGSPCGLHRLRHGRDDVAASGCFQRDTLVKEIVLHVDNKERGPSYHQIHLRSASFYAGSCGATPSWPTVRTATVAGSAIPRGETAPTTPPTKSHRPSWTDSRTMPPAC